MYQQSGKHQGDHKDFATKTVNNNSKLIKSNSNRFIIQSQPSPPSIQSTPKDSIKTSHKKFHPNDIINNLSNYNLTTHEKSLLEKGLNLEELHDK